MQLHFDKLTRGPAWERWLIVELQHGDPAYAGQAIITYSSHGSEATAECDVLFDRRLSDEELDALLDSITSLLCGRGSITVYAGQEIITKEFCLLDHDHDAED